MTHYRDATSNVQHFGRCPDCAARGADTRGDNLAVYSDGHAYCFGCHRVFRNYRRMDCISESNKPAGGEASEIHQINNSLHEALIEKWLLSVNIPKNIRSKYNISVDPRYGSASFQLKRNNENIVKAVRNFREGLPKWNIFGRRNDLWDVFIPENKLRMRQDILFLTEDVPSAIRLCEAGGNSYPILGTSLCLESQAILSQQFPRVFIWLDWDAKNQALSLAKSLEQFNVKTYTNSTMKDPKYLDDNCIDFYTHYIKYK